MLGEGALYVGGQTASNGSTLLDKAHQSAQKGHKFYRIYMNLKILGYIRTMHLDLLTRSLAHILISIINIDNCTNSKSWSSR